jgi:lipopolysaccharide export system ATP-binding protein
VRETLSVTERAYIINEGRIFRTGTPGALGRDPEVKRIYLGENFSLGDASGNAEEGNPE